MGAPMHYGQVVESLEQKAGKYQVVRLPEALELSKVVTEVPEQIQAMLSLPIWASQPMTAGTRVSAAFVVRDY